METTDDAELPIEPLKMSGPAVPVPTEEDYWGKAYRLADELRRHLSTIPVKP